MTKKLLILITLFSLIIRLINVNYPPLLWDEAAIGYNAYSILKTGKDEYGQFLPFVFKSFGDYKPGLYIYLTVPFVAIFGLNPLSVRLPSVILGSLLPLLLYLLITKISPKSRILAIYSSTLLAFNPWNIHFSRGAWETNILLFELVLASYLFFGRRLFLSSLTFAAALYTYQGGKIMVPLLVLGLLLTNYRHLFTKNNLIKFVLPLIIFSLPIIFGLLTQNDSNRLQVFALWSYHRPQPDTAQIISESNPISYQIFHSEPLFFIRNFFTRYFNHFSTRFLLFEGDWQIGRHSAPYIGLILYPSIIFLIIGFFKSLASPKSSLNLFFLYWLIIGPLPSALTRDIIQPVRCLSLSIPLIYFTALGLSQIHFWILKFGNWKLLGTCFFVFCFLCSFIYYIDLYFNHMVKVKPDHWLFGYQPAMNYVINHQDNKTITFTDFYGQPYIYYLFQSQYSPANYQTKSNLISSGPDTGKIEKIDNIYFKTPDFNLQKQQPNQLLIFSYDDALRQGIDLKLLTPLSSVNGHSTFYAYETN